MDADSLDDGLKQLDGYLAGPDLDSGWLVIVDRRSDQPPIEARTAGLELHTPAGRRVTLIRA